MARAAMAAALCSGCRSHSDERGCVMTEAERFWLGVILWLGTVGSFTWLL